MAGDPLELIRAIYGAFSRGDVETPLQYVDADAELGDPDLPGGGTFTGPDGFRQFMEQWLGAFERLEVEVEQLVPAGGRIVALVHQRGTSTSGVPVELRDGHVWTIEDGRVMRLELYLTHEAALAAAGATR